MKRKQVLGAGLAASLAAAMVMGASIGAAEAQGKVVLYTAHKQEIIDALIPRFEAETGIKAEIIKGGSGDIIRRAAAEKDNPQGDVIWSIGAEQLEANSELLENFAPDEIDKIDPVFLVGDKWLPYTGIVITLIVNTDMLSEEDAPKSWMDLTDPSLKGLISSARADKSGSSYTQLVTVLNVFQNSPGNGWDVYADILDNFALSGSSSAVSRFVNDGEAAVGVTLEDNALRFVQGGGPVRIVYPSEGTAAIPDGIALIKNGPNPDNGKAFINWALSKSTQEILVKELGRRPVRTDVAPSGALPPLSDIAIAPYSIAAAAAARDANIKMWTELLINR